MRANFLVMVGSAVLALLAGTTEGISQPPPADGKSVKGKDRQQGPADEEREILKEIKDAYKAPFEVHEDILKELRRAYQQPSPDREAKIFRELRRLYQITPQPEVAILQEIRRAYQQPSAAQEERIFREIQRAERLPDGAVPPSVQVEQAKKIFRKLDVDGDGVLSAAELPESLRGERVRWDANRNGVIDPDEYWAYYQARLGVLSEQVAAGQIDLGLKRGGPTVSPASGPAAKPAVSTIPPDGEGLRTAVRRAGKLPPGLPDWFVRLDTDGDGQVGLYEWRKSGRPLAEFASMDLNDDGFITADELLRYLAQQPRGSPDAAASAGGTKVRKPGSR
jgi:hypothetical protein